MYILVHLNNLCQSMFYVSIYEQYHIKAKSGKWFRSLVTESCKEHLECRTYSCPECFLVLCTMFVSVCVMWCVVF